MNRRFWDPLGLLEDETQEYFDRLRYVEIKHGRIAMLAVLGHITQQNVRLPGMLSTSDNVAFADMPNGLAALTKIPPVGLLQIFLFIGYLEVNEQLIQHVWGVAKAMAPANWV